MAARQSNRRRRERGPDPLRELPPAGDREGLLFSLVQALVAILLAARLLLPPEAAVEGASLWLVELWFVAALMWAWDAWRRDDDRLRLDLLDVAVWVIVLGHVLSALWTFRIGGDRRAALNLMWEWAALGLSFSLLRQVLRRAVDGHRLLLATVCLAAGLAGFGIWQHYLGLPQTRQTYERIVSELTELSQPAPDVTAADARARRARRIELQQQLAEMPIPADPPSLRRFEDRLNSTEPFGLFALANTFAAVLLAWLVVGAGLVLHSWRRPGAAATVPRILFGIATVGLTAYCLVLTKSRTAWVGLAAAMLIWGWSARRGGRGSTAAPRDGSGTQTAGGAQHVHAIRPAVVGAIVLLAAAIVFVAALSGGLDRQVVSEAPKSLRYRLQYWVGAAGVVREHPIVGVGPGNFRQHYLQHKLPASSEEIAEPHNFILDLWASGGMLAVCGSVVLIIAGGRKLAHARRESAPAHAVDQPAESTGSGRAARWLSHPLVWGTGAACLVVLAGPLVLGYALDERLAWVGGAWLLLAMLARLASQVRLTLLPVTAIAASAVGVLVHLLGSGGIEMPAIPQTLLLLLALGTAPALHSGHASWNTSVVQIGTMTAAAVLCATCWVTAAGPVFERETLLAEGDALQSGNASRHGTPNLRSAERFYALAAERDPLSPKPLVRLADVATARMVLSGGLDDADFDAAVRYGRAAISTDPHSAALYHRLGQLYLARFQQTQDPDAARLASESMLEAIRRYPANARLRADAARAFEAAGKGEAARRHARHALEIDEINRREGHADKYLPDFLRMEVRRLSGLE